jgi:putative transposase
MNYFASARKSNLEIGKIYFWTATINNWFRVLGSDNFKQVIIDSLQNLSDRALISVFGFVIMPNHIHLVWRLEKQNGKELPNASLLKFTAHQFKKMLSKEELSKFSVDASNKQYEFWQRDSLGIELYTQEVIYQKMDYIHNNPLNERWNLAQEPSDYAFSSASYYEKGDLTFPFLRHVGDCF